jgi:dihydroorotate dehydrogenase electron transfer subunit
LALVLTNSQVAADVYRLAARLQNEEVSGRMGQFYMLRAWRDYPVLPRPISIHDIEDGIVSYLYRVHGEGTRLLASLRPGDELHLDGPFGNGFPTAQGRVALVGGGMGIAPMLYAARQLPGAHAYLGFSAQPFCVEAFEALTARCTVCIGGTIVDRIDPAAYDSVLACGPSPMLRALRDRLAGSPARLFVSIERRMACGIGACYACSMPDPSGGANRQACKDGPVFEAKEVDWDALDCL